MITVIGASGNVGSKVAIALAEAGHDVRAIGRTAHSLTELAGLGAELATGDIADTEWLTEAIRGSDAVFAMVPSNPFTVNYAAEQERLGTSVCAALRSTGVATVVALSSLGADRPDAPGVIGELRRQEQRLSTLSARVMLLRPVSFFENLLPAADQLIANGSHVDSVQRDLPIPMIATADIARVAAAALTNPTWSGHTARELLGERDLSFDEATAIMGTHLGLADATYVQLPYVDLIDVLVDLGFSAEFADGYVDMTRAFNSRELTDSVPRSATNTTPTSFEQFVASSGMSTTKGTS